MRDIIEKEARGIRGRYAVDVWQRWLDASHDRQEQFLSNYGVQADRVTATRERLYEVLAAEQLYPTDA